MPELTHCPYCRSDQRPNRTIGVEIWGVHDGVLFWRCPDCGGSWHRWSEEDWPRLYDIAQRYVGPPAETDEALAAWAKSMELEGHDAEA